MEHISYTLARLELQGGHYEEALKLYREILLLEPQSSSAWCGMAMAKFGLLLQQRATVYEVFYCFRKAKEMEPAQSEWVEYMMVEASIKIVEEIYTLFHHYHRQLQKLSGQQGRSVIGAVGSVLIGESRWAESNPYRSMLAAGLTAFSLREYFRTESSEVAVKAQRNQWTNVFTSIRYAVDRHVVVALDDKERFQKVVKRLHKELAEAEMPDWVKWLKSMEVDEGPKVQRWSPKMKAYAHFLRGQARIRKALEANPHHPFHGLKKEALLLYQWGRYRDAYHKSGEALDLYVEDEELQDINDNARKALVRPLKRGALAAGVVAAGLYFAKNSLLSTLPLPQWVYIATAGVLFVIALILSIKVLRY